MPAPVYVSAHPLIQHKLARLRAVDTKPPEFRALVAAISRGLFFEATRDLRLVPVAVQTPLTQATCQQIADRVGLVPVLRAGLGMAEAMLDALPEATVWHLGLYRDHVTLKPVTYYNKLPHRPDMEKLRRVFLQKVLVADKDHMARAVPMHGLGRHGNRLGLFT